MVESIENNPLKRLAEDLSSKDAPDKIEAGLRMDPYSLGVFTGRIIPKRESILRIRKSRGRRRWR